MTRSTTHRPLPARIRERIGNPLEWDETWKVGILLGLVTCSLIVFAPRYFFLLDHPETEPYLSRPVLRNLAISGAAYLVFAAGWLALGVHVRRTDRLRRAYVHVANQSWWIMFALLAYVNGLVTSPVWVVFVFIGFCCLLLFDARVTAAGVATSLALIAVTTLAERAGALPYGPLYTAWPEIDGRLDDAWVASYTIWPALFSVVIFFLVAAILNRSRRQAEQLARASEQLTRSNELISRYVAAQVAEQILSGNVDVVERHARRKLTVFFSDIRGFTEIAERLEPEDLSLILNEYLTEMTRIVDDFGGTIDKFVGDAIMVFFGAPSATNDRDHATRAVRMAIEMQEKLPDLRARWRDRAIEEDFEVRMGINSGQASIGTFGSHGRMDYTAIGRNVNLAARLQASCEPGKILISHPTWILVQHEIPCTPKGEIEVKGLRDPVRAYEVDPRSAHAPR